MSAPIKSENTPDYLLIESAGILTSKEHLFKYIQMVTDEIFKNWQQEGTRQRTCHTIPLEPVYLFWSGEPLH